MIVCKGKTKVSSFSYGMTNTTRIHHMFNSTTIRYYRYYEPHTDYHDENYFTVSVWRRKLRGTF